MGPLFFHEEFIYKIFKTLACTVPKLQQALKKNHYEQTKTQAKRNVPHPPNVFKVGAIEWTS